MALILMIFSGILVGFGNYCMRRAMIAGGQSRNYILIQLFLSALWTFALGPLAHMQFAISTSTWIYGALTGLCLAFFMKCLGHAMARGPVSLTVAFINASTLLPALVFFLLFGASWGFEYHLTTFIGSLLVLLALYQATQREFKKNTPTTSNTPAISKQLSMAWLVATFGCFFFHTLMLILIQLRAMSLLTELPEHFLLLKSSTQGSEAFLPIMLMSAWLVRLVDTKKEHFQLPIKQEWFFGGLGGFANGASIHLMAIATMVATGLQGAMMFPLYSVSIIITCNLWSALLYKESVYWPASVLAILGIITGTVNWTALLGS